MRSTLVRWMGHYWSAPLIRPGGIRPVDYGTAAGAGCPDCDSNRFTAVRDEAGRLTARCLQCGKLCPEILNPSTQPSA
jgi:hypothetical protein